MQEALKSKTRHKRGDYYPQRTRWRDNKGQNKTDNRIRFTVPCVRRCCRLTTLLWTQKRQPIYGEVLEGSSTEDRLFLCEFFAFLQDESSSILAEEFGKGNIPERQGCGYVLFSAVGYSPPARRVGNISRAKARRRSAHVSIACTTSMARCGWHDSRYVR